MASRHTPVSPAPPQVATNVLRSAPPNVPSRPADWPSRELTASAA